MLPFLGPALQGARVIGGASQLGRYALGLGSLLGAGLTADTARRSNSVGSIPPRDKTGESYRDAELRLSAAARAAGGPAAGGGFGGGNAASFIPYASSGFSGGGTPAAERAYQSEASRVAQMTAQNPDLQRYETARAAAAKSGDQSKMDSARDIGMQIWAQRNPTLAAKVKSGQSGYDAIQGVLNAGQMGAPIDLPFNTSNPLSTTPVPATAEYGSTTPAQLPPGAALPTNAFGNVRPGMFQTFLNQTPLQVSPLGDAGSFGQVGYGSSVAPIGGLVTDEAFKTDKARQMAEMYKSALLSGVK